MFPTAGLFRGVLCPENDENKGRCRRPYCHFRHIRRVPFEEPVTEPKYSGEQKTTKARPTIESSSLPSHRRPKDRTPTAKPIQYVPTPLFLCKKPIKDAFAEESTEEEEQGSKDDGSPSAPGKGMSTYTPTPLAELEAMATADDDQAFEEDSLSTGADAGDHIDVQAAKTKSNNYQAVASLSTDEEDPREEKPSVSEEEGEDMIIETHTYGGVTVTTRTPRSLCQSSQAADEEDDEYNPFSSVMGSSEKSRPLTKDNKSSDGGHNGTSQLFSRDKEAVSIHNLEANFEPFSKSDEYPAYGTSNDLMDDSERRGKEFMGYSNSASYSYSDASNAGPLTNLEYHPSYSYTPLETDQLDELPAYSTSQGVNEEDNFDRDLDGGYDLDNLEQYHEEETNKDDMKRTFEKKSRVDKQLSREKPLEKSDNSKMKLGAEKKVKTSAKKAVTASSHKTIQPSKGKQTIVSGKETKVSPKAKPSMGENNPKKVMPSNKKVPHRRTEVSSTPKAGNVKTESGKEAREKTSSSTKGPSSEHDSCLEVKVSEKSKPKVSAEQLANFFKKRQESTGSKPLGKKKGELKGTTQANSLELKSTEERNSVKDATKGKEHRTNNQRNDPHPSKKLLSGDTKESIRGKQGTPKTPTGDRSLFQSLGKPPVVPKKPSVKECDVDLFATANDSSSDDDGDSRSKVSSKLKGSAHGAPPRKRSVSSDKNKHTHESENLAKKKRTASPSKTNDPKRLKKLSTSSVKKESTKVIELDLFGDDSDGDSDGINFISDGECPNYKIPKKSTESSISKNKGSSPKSPRPLQRTVARSSSAGASGSAAGNFLPSTKVKSSSLNSSKADPSKKPGSAVTQKRTATGQGQKHSSKGTLSVKKDHFDKQEIVKKGHTTRDISHQSIKHQKGKNLSHKTVYDISSSEDEDSSDLPNGFASSDNDDHDVGGANDDDGYHGNEGGDQDDEYMAEMKRFMEESSSEDDISDECYRIFQEDQGSASRSSIQMQRKRPEEQRDTNSAPVSVGKQRVAHASKFGNPKRKTAPKNPAISRPSPAQMCHNRYRMMEHRQERASLERESGESSAGASFTGKKRIAHQPGTSNNTLKQLTLGASSSNKTTMMTAKMGKRVAHMPKTVSKRPVIPTDYGSKVPMNIRQRYLNVFIDELLKTAEEDQDAFNKALEEEKLVYQRASTKNIYLNLCVNALKKLKNQTDSRLQSPPSTPTVLFPSKVVSHEAVLGGKLAAQTSYSIHKHSSIDSECFEGIHLYEKLERYVLTEEQLRENGYPRPSEVAGQAIIYKEEQNKKIVSSDPNQQVCCRCGTSFLRKPDGKYITRESCTYHWGRPWTRRIAGVIESRFSCCSGDMETKGCCISKLHVTENKYDNLSGFMKTMPKDIPRNGHPGMYSLDCEMCYTTMGLELTRVTVVDEQLREVYDTLVQPDNDVVDYNTRFSGITEDDLKHVSTKLRDVQAVLLNMFSAQTILIGHSLESDMLALKLLHSTVVDTAIVFPHRRGPPLKRALKTLMAEYLKRLIQDDVGGHDSAEDARSCMELMIYKAKEDAKVKRKR